MSVIAIFDNILMVLIKAAWLFRHFVGGYGSAQSFTLAMTDMQAYHVALAVRGAC